MAAISTATALLFPGQGSQTDEMRDAVSELRPDLLALATEHLGVDPFPRVDKGTVYAQPALYCASVAAWERLGRPRAEAAVGHSLGELAALVAARSLDERDGLRLAVRRGQLMEEAAGKDPGGGMMALLGDEGAAARIAVRCGLCVANHNAPGQIVVSGPSWKLEAARQHAKRAGLKAIKLRVEGAFHSPAMAAVLPAYRAELARVEFRPPVVKVFSSIVAGPFDDVRDRLAEALVRPVRWRETLAAMHSFGIKVFREVGPGKVLTNLVRRTLPDVTAEAVDEAPAHA
jgi:[acyl-carrier-protein] S-malonyltransferase